MKSDPNQQKRITLRISWRGFAGLVETSSASGVLEGWSAPSSLFLSSAMKETYKKETLSSVNKEGQTGSTAMELVKEIEGYVMKIFLEMKIEVELLLSLTLSLTYLVK